MNTNNAEYFIIWGAICEDLADAQIVWERWTTRSEAEAKMLDLDDNPTNHPDLFFWLEASTDEACGYCGRSQDPNDICKSCWDNMQPDSISSTHTTQCEEYWDRGLECRCIPEGVKQDIRNGANPEDVM